MTRSSFTDLCFDIERLRFDAVATLQALCNRFEPDHADGLRMLLNAAEYVQHTVIGPPETDPRRMLNPFSTLPSACSLVDFAEPAELAVLLTEQGWPTEIQTLWNEDDDEADGHFVNSARSVIAFRFERTMRVTVTAPEPRQPHTSLFERGQYLACASGERLFFTDALCRLPLDRDAAELDLTAVPGFWIGAMRAECDTCATRWRVDPSGDFHALSPTGDPVWNFFEEAADLAYVSATFACPDLGCTGRITLALT